MKIVAGFLALAHGQEVRRVPPRTPDQRLNTICRFSKEWIGNTMNVDDSLGQFVPGQPGDAPFKYMPRPERSANIVARIDYMCEKLEENYVREKKIKRHGGITMGLRLCSFFDPLVPNGGPRPTIKGERSQQERDVFAMLEELESGNWMVGIEDQVAAVFQEEFPRHRRELDDYDDLDFFDPFDAAEEDYEAARSSIINVRLANELGFAWRQIATGFRKWILRYVAECNGQREYQMHTKRLIKIATKINKLIYDVNGQKPIDFNRAVWQNVGYEMTDSPPTTLETTTSTTPVSTTST